jgi:peptidoglycan/LPS O-acetylase OafA/YrhL
MDDQPVIWSQIAGLVIIVLGLALGLKAGSLTDAWVWSFLNSALIPVALGVLIIVVASASRKGNRLPLEPGSHGDGQVGQ